MKLRKTSVSTLLNSIYSGISVSFLLLRSPHNDGEAKKRVFQFQEVVHRRYDENFYKLPHLQRSRD